jgi:eukaryotic translation initiation factor 2C
MIEEMEAMVVERLQLYKARNKALPQRIIFYRDGVSEGQFDLVLQHELPQIQRACTKVYGAKDPKPLLSIIICGKRYVGARPRWGLVADRRSIGTTHDRYRRPSTRRPTTGTRARGRSSTRASPTYIATTSTSRCVLRLPHVLTELTPSQAHKGLQGTVRSTHYTVIYDENKLPVDTLQQGTHTASYSYARATKAVRSARPRHPVLLVLTIRAA